MPLQELWNAVSSVPTPSKDDPSVKAGILTGIEEGLSAADAEDKAAKVVVPFAEDNSDRTMDKVSRFLLLTFNINKAFILRLSSIPWHRILSTPRFMDPYL